VGSPDTSIEAIEALLVQGEGESGTHHAGTIDCSVLAVAKLLYRVEAKLVEIEDALIKLIPPGQE